MRVLLIENTPADAVLIRHVLDTVPPVESVTWRHTVPRKVSDRYDLVVLDLGIPPYVGAAALQALRSVAPDVAVLVCTGSKDPALHREVADLDAALVAKEQLVTDLGPAIMAAFGYTPSAPIPTNRIAAMRQQAAQEVRRRFEASESGVRHVAEKVRERITKVRKALDEGHECGGGA